MLNKKTQYAFQALVYLVEHKDNGPVLIAEIAEITGLNESQVKVYIFRARVTLREYIKRLDLVI